MGKRADRCRTRHQRWFDRAADALARNWQVPRRGYVCPLCFR